MIWTVIILVIVAVGAAILGRPVSRYTTFVSRTGTLCVRKGVYDGKKMAQAKQHTEMGRPAMPPERGSVTPWGIQNGLPRTLLIYGRVDQDGRDWAGFLRELAHYSGREWTLKRRDGSRWIVVRQAAPLPDRPARPDPLAVPPWILPIGGDRDHVPALWDVTHAYHLFVCGMTGWWKSSFALWLADYAGRMPYWRVVRIDPEKDSPAVQLDKLHIVEREFDRRDPEVEPTSRVLVIVDEARNVMRVPPKTHPQHETHRQIAMLIDEFTDRGGKRGIHLVDLTVDPKLAAIGRRSSFGARMAGGLETHEWPLVFGRDVPHPTAGPGCYWWQRADGAPLVEIRVHAIPYQRPYQQARYEEPTTTTVTRIFGAIGDRTRR